MTYRFDRIVHIFQFMEYDYISDDQHDLVVSYERQFKQSGTLTDRQFEVLESIFEQAASKA